MKPNFKEILNNSLRVTSEIAAEAVGNNPKYFNEVIKLSLHEKSPLNWGAARVVLIIVEKYPNLFNPYVNELGKAFTSFTNDGLKRTYAHILSNYVKLINEDVLSNLIELCFAYMLKDEKVAVKYNCMNFLYETTKLFPELKGELKASIDFNLSNNIFRMNGNIKKVYEML